LGRGRYIAFETPISEALTMAPTPLIVSFSFVVRSSQTWISL